MNNKMQLNDRLHKLNTAQIITFGFAGVIILGDCSCGCPLCGTRESYFFSDAMFTANYLCLRDRAGHSK